jgi:hypothetical protein
MINQELRKQCSLFESYLSFLHHKRSNPNEESCELETIAWELMNYSLPKKVEVYRSMIVKEFRDIYRKSFLDLKFP